MTTFEQAVVRRCTRNGVTLWQHVAKQLGRSVDSVRQEYDPEYRRDEFAASLKEAAE